MKLRFSPILLNLLLIVSSFISWPALSAYTDDSAAEIRILADNIAEKFQRDPVIVNAVMAQNREQADLSSQSIARLNDQWLAELSTPNRNLIARKQNSEISLYLQRLKRDSNGQFLELIVMDDKGLNVGQSGITSDYWQGDEDKWIKPFVEASGHVFIDELRWDESVQNYEIQISFTLFDLTNNSKIGAMTVGLRIDKEKPVPLSLK